MPDIDHDLNASELRDIRELLEIEKIRRLKQRYCHLIDGGRIDALGDIYTEDAICGFGPKYGEWVGREMIMEMYHTVMDEVIKFGTMHSVVNHYVDIVDSETAHGRAYLIDIVTTVEPHEQPILWFAFYDDEYKKVEGRWFIKRSNLQFLWPERSTTSILDEPFPANVED